MLRTRNSSTQRSWIQLAVAFLLGIVLTVVLFTGPRSRTAPDTGWRKELETSISNRKLIQESSSQDKAPKKKLLAIVGVQTGFSHVGSSSGYDYPKRRAALRKTWFPASQAEADRLEAEQSILYRFVIGHSLDNRQELAVNSEMKENGACIRLPLIEDYMSLTRKTLLFLQYVYERYDAEYIMKVDDDVYLRTDRLAPIINQWTLSGSDYIGCMKTGQVFRDQNLRWFEPQNSLIGGKMYFTHAWGSIYVLSKHAAGVLATLSAAVPDGLRFFINEDVTVGGWMLAMNVTHLDDRRLCESECTPATLAVYDIPQCAGLCDAPKKLPELHADPKCHSPVLNEDGEVPNLRPFFLFQSVRPS